MDTRKQGIYASELNRFLIHVLPLIIAIGGYGFGKVYSCSYLRQAIGIIFWLAIWLNVVLYVAKVGGRGYTHKTYERLLENHNTSVPSRAGVFPDCYQAPHDILLHKYFLE